MNSKVVIVTGGNRGIGLAIAKAFVHVGANVVINYRSDDHQAEIALKGLNDISKQAIFVKADVSEASGRERLLAETLHHFNRVDVLVNNAGITSRIPFLETQEEDFDRIMNCNLKAPLFLAKIVAKQMVKQKQGGVIINISSSAGHRAFNNLIHSLLIG